MKGFFREEKGAVQVTEAALVYPLVILTLVALIYIGMYVFEVSYMSDRARSAAVTAAKTLTFAGYDELGDIYSRAGLRPEDTPPDKYHVEKAYSGGKPYRYFSEISADSRFKQYTEAFASDMLFYSPDVVCTVDVQRRLFDRQVVVTAEKSISLPGVLKVTGVGTGRKISVSASAVTADPAEFIRNTDLTVDAAVFFGEKTGITDALSGIRGKISSVLKKK